MLSRRAIRVLKAPSRTNVPEALKFNILGFLIPCSPCYCTVVFSSCFFLPQSAHPPMCLAVSTNWTHLPSSLYASVTRLTASHHTFASWKHYWLLLNETMFRIPYLHFDRNSYWSYHCLIICKSPVIFWRETVYEFIWKSYANVMLVGFSVNLLYSEELRLDSNEKSLKRHC